MPFERWLYVLRMRLRSLFRRDRLDAELDEELQDHVARLVEQRTAAGLTPADARRAALRAMGGIGAADPSTIAAAVLTLVAVALLAAFLPAWRASRIEPVAALRFE
jgi:hypothetical protein